MEDGRTMSEWAEVSRAVRASVRSIADFPEPGILFRDITPLLAQPDAFNAAIDWYAACCDGADAIAGVEARGFIFGAVVAQRLGPAVHPSAQAGQAAGADDRAEL